MGLAVQDPKYLAFRFLRRGCVRAGGENLKVAAIAFGSAYHRLPNGSASETKSKPRWPGPPHASSKTGDSGLKRVLHGGVFLARQMPTKNGKDGHEGRPIKHEKPQAGFYLCSFGCQRIRVLVCASFLGASARCSNLLDRENRSACRAASRKIDSVVVP